MATPGATGMKTNWSWVRPWMVFWVTLTAGTFVAVRLVDADHSSLAETIALLVAGAVYLWFQHRHPRLIRGWLVFLTTLLYVYAVGEIGACAGTTGEACAYSAGYVSFFLGLVIAGVNYQRYWAKHLKAKRRVRRKNRAKMPGLGP